MRQRNGQTSQRLLTNIISLIHKPVDSTEVCANARELRRVKNDTALNCVVGGWRTEQWIGSVNRRPNNTDCEMWANSR